MPKIPRDLRSGVIHEWSTGGPVPLAVKHAGSPIKAVLFVHGILSDHTTYANCQAKLVVGRPNWRFYYVDYDFNEPIADNGRHLAKALREHFNDADHVVVVAHSMGGVVARYACLSQKLPFVRTLFLLGTPNQGAFRTATLTILAQMSGGVIGQLWGVRPKKVGVFDLTRVDRILRPLLDNSAHTDHIDYVTIPGRYFYRGRGFFEHDSSNIWRVIFGGLDVGLELVRAFLPLLSINMQRAHDGIVEEVSNQLMPEKVPQPDSERRLRSEKRKSLRRPPPAPATYAHVVADAADDLMHVQLTGSEFVISIINEIIEEPSLDIWMPAARVRYGEAVDILDRDP
ncbi:pimeloyl-ACP methyl ester carboxylesterase [Bradyrhizobium sp. USDA 4459]